MPAEEQTIEVGQDISSKSRQKNLARTSKPSKFIFDAALSTAVAANGQRPTKAPQPDGPLTPDMLDKMNRYWRAANYLCIGQIYLFRKPSVARASESRTDQTKVARALGNFAGTKSYLHSSEPPHQRARCQHHLYCRSRTRRSVAECVLLSGRHLYRSTSRDHAR